MYNHICNSFGRRKKIMAYIRKKAQIIIKSNEEYKWIHENMISNVMFCKR